MMRGREAASSWIPKREKIRKDRKAGRKLKGRMGQKGSRELVRRSRRGKRRERDCFIRHCLFLLESE